MQAGGGAKPKFQKQGKGKSPGKNGKAKAKHAHSIVFKTVPSAKGIVSGLEEASTSNSVTSEPSVSLSLGVQELTRSFQQETDSLKHLFIPAMYSLVTQSTTRGIAH